MARWRNFWFIGLGVLIGLVIALGMYFVLIKKNTSPMLSNLSSRPSLNDLYQSSKNNVNPSANLPSDAIPLGNPAISSTGNNVNLTPSQSLTDQDVVSFDLKSREFLKGVYDAMHTYLLGNNTFIDGWRATDVVRNGYGDVIKLKIDGRLYEAKEYFNKFVNDISLLQAPDSNSKQIENLLIQAAELKMQGIGLITKGLLIQHERGETLIQNMLNSNPMGNSMPIGENGVSIVEQQTRQVAPPIYNGEVEDGTGKINIANTYYVDALKLLKTFSSQFPNDGSLTYPDFDYDINYYSQDTLVPHNNTSQ